MRFCSHCGKEIVDEAVICLNCGCKTHNKAVFTPNNTTVVNENAVVCEDGESQLAMWSKICGIISFFVGWFALGITAIVLACISKDETNGVMNSSAKTGYVCGIISTVLSFVLFIILIAVLTALSI